MNREEHETLYRRSLENLEAFWLEQAELLSWSRKPTRSLEFEWNTPQRIVRHQCYADGELNVAFNCLDRHLDKSPEKIAVIWQGEREEEVRRLSYRELHALVCRFSNVLIRKGIKKGDRVAIYMPMIPEALVAMLACARLGAIHSVVFAGFSSDSLANRIHDAQCSLLITADCVFRAGKTIPLKPLADAALAQCPEVKHAIVYRRGTASVPMSAGRDSWWHEEMAEAKPSHRAEPMNAEDPLFILYTSGSTGKPKGVVHTMGGYLTYATLTFRQVFDYRPEETYWCTADVGWITGHTYIVYGPLSSGATLLLFEGVPTYPDFGRFWQIIETHRVNTFYTSPTAIRSLMREGTSWPEKYDLRSLRLLGSVGEPINPEAWQWFYRHIGREKCPIVDTWWQTETGGILITPLPGFQKLKPGSATRPFLGILPAVLRDDGTPCSPNESGKLCIQKPWPGMARTLWRDHDRFIDTYFTSFENRYFTGDSCRVDEDGDYWLQGRVDDTIKVSGHLIGTAEVESALVSHPSVAEAAIVAVPHEIKGHSLYAFVTLKREASASEALKTELIQHVGKTVGPIAKPEKIQFADALPKTRSGKIMRRILKKIANRDLSDLGDTSTLADPSVIETLTQGRALT